MRTIYLMIIFAVSISHLSFAEQSLCDYKVEILLNNSEFDTGDFNWRMRAVKINGDPANITGTAEIIDSKGQTVKKYKPWTSEPISKQKTSSRYTPNLQPGEYTIKAQINVTCEDEDKSNNLDVKKAIIKERSEKISEDFNASKNQYIILEKEDNSTKSIDDNILNKSPQENISAKEQNIKTAPIINQIETGEQNFIIGHKSVPSAKENKIIYESSSEKAKNLIIFFLLALSVLLNIVLIWRR